MPFHCGGVNLDVPPVRLVGFELSVIFCVHLRALGCWRVKAVKVATKYSSHIGCAGDV